MVKAQRIGRVSKPADRLSSSDDTPTKRLFRETMDSRRGACSECGTPTVARPPRTRALYERETGIDRTGACACPLLRLFSSFSSSSSTSCLLRYASWSFFASLSLSALLSSPLLSARFRASLPSSPTSPTTGRECDSDHDRDHDRGQTDWINRKPRRLQVTDRHPFRERRRNACNSWIPPRGSSFHPP